MGGDTISAAKNPAPAANGRAARGGRAKPVLDLHRRLDVAVVHGLRCAVGLPAGCGGCRRWSILCKWERVGSGWMVEVGCFHTYLGHRSGDGGGGPTATVQMRYLTRASLSSRNTSRSSSARLDGASARGVGMPRFLDDGSTLRRAGGDAGRPILGPFVFRGRAAARAGRRRMGGNGCFDSKREPGRSGGDRCRGPLLFGQGMGNAQMTTVATGLQAKQARDRPEMGRGDAGRMERPAATGRQQPKSVSLSVSHQPQTHCSTASLHAQRPTGIPGAIFGDTRKNEKSWDGSGLKTNAS